jgi:hypothetical protein
MLLDYPANPRMLLLKLTLVPAFLYLLALVARYYGPHRAGWMAGLPWWPAPSCGC